MVRNLTVMWIALCLVIASSRIAPAQQSFDRWLSAVERHQPGKADDAAKEIAAWSNGDLLVTISAIRRAALPNATLKRGAVLHLDLALLLKGKATGPLFPTAQDRAPTYTVLDGRPLGLAETTLRPQLDFARALLELVQPSPRSDHDVRFWYITTASALQRSYELAEALVHLREARILFPDSQDVRLAWGCLYETFASPRFQAIVRSGAARGRSLAVGTERQNLIRAEQMFRETLAVNPEYAEARLRLGRTLALQGRHEDAVKELQHAAKLKADPMGSYYTMLFLGREEEVLGRAASARTYFERAAKIYPQAQSPHLALSRLAFHDGDTRRAEQAVAQVMALPNVEQDRFDPWWVYYEGLGRFVHPLLERLYSSVTVDKR